MFTELGQECERQDCQIQRSPANVPHIQLTFETMDIFAREINLVSMEFSFLDFWLACQQGS